MKRKQAVVIVVSLLAAVFCLGGCKGKSQGAGSSAGNADAGNSFAEKIELSVAMWGIGEAFNDPNAKNDTIYNALSEKFNVTIKPIQVTWNDWQEKSRIWAASDQLPDLFIADAPAGQYNTWATQGVIKALPDDLSKFPNIQAVMAQPSVKPLAVDGKFYKFPRMTYATANDWVNDRNIIYRKDWLKQAGYDHQPQSFEEFVEMSKKVMAQHPGAVGISSHHHEYLAIFMLGIYPEGGKRNVWAKEDGLWKPNYATRGFAQGVAQLRTLYKEGILDPDFALLKDEEGVAKYMNGKAFGVLSGTVRWSYEEAWKAANPGITAEEAIGFMDIWPAPDGNRYYFSETPYWSETMFNGKLSDKKMERALYLLDYMYSDEYQVQKANGVEGVDFTIDNGAYVSLLPEGESLGKKYPITNSMGSLSAWGGWLPYVGKQVISTDPYVAYTDRLNIENLNYKKATAKPMPVNYDIKLMSTPAKDKASSLDIDSTTDTVRVIMGNQDPIAMWQEVIKSYEGRGMAEAIKEVNEKAKELGIQ
ncbi:sugar ABC transporter substrate-binding protein [Spirochaetia bacterium]|nr:sugar ABC transporter substrate-binding protein [Spirochaetia bacterium]